MVFNLFWALGTLICKKLTKKFKKIKIVLFKDTLNDNLRSSDTLKKIHDTLGSAHPSRNTDLEIYETESSNKHLYTGLSLKNIIYMEIRVIRKSVLNVKKLWWVIKPSSLSCLILNSLSTGCFISFYFLSYLKCSKIGHYFCSKLGSSMEKTTSKKLIWCASCDFLHQFFSSKYVQNLYMKDLQNLILARKWPNYEHVK